MPNITKNQTNEYDEWMRIEEVGIRASQVRSALLIGNWALQEKGCCIGGIAEEMSDFIYIVNHFLEDMENTCQSITDSLLAKVKAAKEGVA